jgi:hypothetical protein
MIVERVGYSERLGNGGAQRGVTAGFAAVIAALEDDRVDATPRE